MGIRDSAAAPRIALALGFFLAPPVCIICHLGFMSPAMGQADALTKKQSDALNAYNNAVNNLKSILKQLRAQIDSKQALTNLAGQAVHL